VLLVGVGLYIADYYNLLPRRAYTAGDFNIATVYSEVDYNDNGIDDYTDILLGAKLDAENCPTYNGAYYGGGYPPDDIGVCTDVVWRAFKNAGFDLREMLNNDIIARPGDYPNVEQRDKNIDFRRVGNLRVFFDKYALSISTDITYIEEWQPGDIVIFGDDKHIGIVSDKRNNKGQPYIIHNYGQPKREQDFLKHSNVTGHYRFDASEVSEDIIVKWSD
jgi:uncharacterized protein YijF (DUF1287 family)